MCFSDASFCSSPDDLWKAACLENWGETRRVLPERRDQDVTTYHEAWKGWRRSFNGYKGISTAWYICHFILPPETFNFLGFPCHYLDGVNPYATCKAGVAARSKNTILLVCALQARVIRAIAEGSEKSHEGASHEPSPCR